MADQTAEQVRSGLIAMDSLQFLSASQVLNEIHSQIPAPLQEFQAIPA